MPIRKYANATPPGGDTSEYSASDYSANPDSAKLVNNSVYTETNYLFNNTVSDYTVSADSAKRDYTVAAVEQIKQSLTKMQPAYRSAVDKRQKDPLAWRTEKLLRKLRPMLSNDNFMEVSLSLTKADVMERVAIVQRLEEWLEVAHGYGND